MARKKRTGQAPPPTPPSIPSQEAIKLLAGQKEKAKGLLEGQELSKIDLEAWGNTTRAILIQAFGSDSYNVWDVINPGTDMEEYRKYPGLPLEHWRREGLKASIKMLDSCIDQLELLAPSQEPEEERREVAVDSRDVFVVHGHDEGKKEAVARLLEKLDVNPIILHEKPNQGRTLIEKFEHNADVGFAVVILTGDDLAGPVNHPENQRPRARQNVVFELGYFIGRLGRDRVCALHEQGIELPSDYEGVAYVPYDPAGAWKMLIARELKAAGIEVDANQAI